MRELKQIRVPAENIIRLRYGRGERQIGPTRSTAAITLPMALQTLYQIVRHAPSIRTDVAAVRGQKIGTLHSGRQLI